jgi:hypothetical protein
MRTAFALCMLLVALFSSGPLSAQEYKGPRMELKEARHDFGKVVQGTQVSYVFEVRNAGAEPLIIERLEPS